MSKTKTETPVLCNSADIPWEETRLRHKVDKRIYVLLLFFNSWRYGNFAERPEDLAKCMASFYLH